jgi:hypothetical protein
VEVDRDAPQSDRGRYLAPLALDRLQYAEKLGHPADQQALVIHIDPGPSVCREYDVVSGTDRHAHAGGFPPVNPLTNCEHDAVLRWRFGGPLGYHEPRLPHPLGLEFLDHYSVEERFEGVTGHG